MTEDTLESILKAAYFYQAHDVVYACCDYFTESLAFHNCIGIMMTADLYALECLQKSSRKFVNENFLKVRITSRHIFYLYSSALINIIYVCVYI